MHCPNVLDCQPKEREFKSLPCLIFLLQLRHLANSYINEYSNRSPIGGEINE